jgi:hypothetical protein
VALGKKASAGSAGSSGASAKGGNTNPLNDVGRAVGRLFGK